MIARLPMTRKTIVPVRSIALRRVEPSTASMIAALNGEGVGDESVDVDPGVDRGGGALMLLVGGVDASPRLCADGAVGGVVGADWIDWPTSGA